MELPRRVAVSSRMSIVLMMLLVLFVQLFAFFVEVVLHLQHRIVECLGLRVSGSSFLRGLRLGMVNAAEDKKP